MKLVSKLTDPLPTVDTIITELPTLAVGFVTVSVLTLIYIISLPVFILRFVVSKLAPYIKPELKHPVTSQGNLFTSDLFETRAPRCAIVVPIVIEGYYTKADCLARLNEMINWKDKETGQHKYPEFKQFIDPWFGFAFWRDDPNFNIDNHVRFIETDSSPAIDKDITQIMEELLNKPFQRGQSPWEICCIQRYEDPELQCGEKGAFVIRFHHSMADGYSILYALIEGLLQAPLSSIPLPNPNYVKRSAFDKLWFTATFPFRLVYDTSHYFAKGLRSNPWNVPDEKKLWKQVYGKSRLVPIDRIKFIKNELNVSFTSVILSAISAGVSRAIKDTRGEKRISCFIPLPLPSHPKALKNHVTGAQIDLPMEKFLDPIRRVKECESLIQQQKMSTIPLLLSFLSRTAGYNFMSVVGKLTRNRVNPIGLTNFPGSNEEILFRDNKKVLSVNFAAGGLTGITGVAFMAISYAKHMRFGVTAEASILNNAEVNDLLKLVTDEIDQLCEIVKSGECITNGKMRDISHKEIHSH